MVADGKNLWFYDRELAQVTVKPIAAALSSTPIMLLSSSPEQLRETFDMTPGGTHDGLLWVRGKAAQRQRGLQQRRARIRSDSAWRA